MELAFELFPQNSNDTITLKSNNNNVTVNGMHIYGNWSGDSILTATTTGGAEYQFNVHVKSVNSIALTSLPTKQRYTVGEDLDKKGLTVTVNYSDKTTETVNDYVITGYDKNKIGVQTLTVEYTSMTGVVYKKTFDVEVVSKYGKLTGIKIDKLPNKTTYVKRDSFDSTGLKVSAVYDTGLASEVTDYTISGYNALKTGTQTITITYGDFKETFDILVLASSISSLELTTKPTKLTYSIGETLDTTGMVLTAKFSNGTTSVINTGFKTTYDFSTVGNKTVTIEYAGITVSYSVSVVKEICKHTNTKWVILKQPTCTQSGSKKKVCSNCGEVLVANETIPATGHSYTSQITKKATCTSTGIKTFTCSVCNDSYTETIPATGHKFDNGKITEQPTETTTGVKTYTCTVCGATKTETIPKLTHTHSYTSEITKEPTCTEIGVKTYTCECGNSYTEAIPATGHKFGSWTTTKKATCTTDGEQQRECSVCGKTETKTIPKTAHSYKKVTVASTYFAKGYTGNKCTKCGLISNKKYTSLKTMPAPKASSNSTSSVKLSWSKVSGAKGYNVYQMKNGKWTRIKTLSSTALTVSKLKSSTTYQFCIKPYTKSGSKTVYGNISKTLTTSTNPATVSFKLTVGSRRVTVKWSKVTGASGYKVYYKTSKNGSWKTLKTCNNKTTSYTKTGLSKGKTYYFTVKSYRTVGGKTYSGAFTTKSMKIK